jgi:hypothetical protein
MHLQPGQEHDGMSARTDNSRKKQDRSVHHVAAIASMDCVLPRLPAVFMSSL